MTELADRFEREAEELSLDANLKAHPEITDSGLAGTSEMESGSTKADWMSEALSSVASLSNLRDPHECLKMSGKCDECVNAESGCGLCLANKLCLPKEAGWCEASQFVANGGTASCSDAQDGEPQNGATQGRRLEPHAIKHGRSLWHSHRPHHHICRQPVRVCTNKHWGCPSWGAWCRYSGWVRAMCQGQCGCL